MDIKILDVVLLEGVDEERHRDVGLLENGQLMGNVMYFLQMRRISL